MLTQNNPDQTFDSSTSSGSASEGNTANNSGESAVQGPKDIVNEQEQNKSVNQEEFISANTEFANSMKDGLPAKDKPVNQQASEVEDDTDESGDDTEAED